MAAVILVHLVQDGIYSFGKAHMRSTAFLSAFGSSWHLRVRKSPYALHRVSKTLPQRCPRNSSNVHPMARCRLSRKIAKRFFFLRLPSPDSRGCDVTGLVPAASQHFRFSETRATCDGCFASRSACSDISLHSGMSLESTSTPVFQDGCLTLTHVILRFTVPVFLGEKGSCAFL